MVTRRGGEAVGANPDDGVLIQSGRARSSDRAQGGDRTRASGPTKRRPPSFPGGGTLLESVWKQCLDYLESALPLKQFDTWLRPLQAEVTADGLCLLAPNEYVRDWVDQHYREQIRDTLEKVGGGQPCSVTVAVGSIPSPETQARDSISGQDDDSTDRRLVVGLQSKFQFSSFIEGKSNQLALAASLQVAENPGIYNPLLIYGAVGLGKTHLIHAIGNVIMRRARARVAYLPAMDFVRDMVSSLRHNRMDQFNQYYRSFDALLVDDIQFFAGKTKSQEEFFHAFDALLQGDHQIVLTCDRYPRDIDHLPERLTSRFASGISYAIEPPDLETRAAILTAKAAVAGVELPEDVALFLAQRLKSNVRDLEGALRRVIMGSGFHSQEITIDYCTEALQDLFSSHDHSVTIEVILKTVADYFRLRVSDLTSMRRSRAIVRPRQIAMALARELTNRSFPEIAASFGDRNHTTILYACRKVEKLRKIDSSVDTDYRNLLRRLRT